MDGEAHRPNTRGRIMKQCKYDTPCNCVRCTTARAEARRMRQEAEADPLAGTVPYVYKPKTAEAKAEAKAKVLSCPVCGGDVGWDTQDVYEVAGIRFTESIQRCASTGDCWTGTIALLPRGRDWFDHKPRPPCRMAAEAAKRDSTGGKP